MREASEPGDDFQMASGILGGMVQICRSFAQELDGEPLIFDVLRMLEGQVAEHAVVVCGVRPLEASILEYVLATERAGETVAKARADPRKMLRGTSGSRTGCGAPARRRDNLSSGPGNLRTRPRGEGPRRWRTNSSKSEEASNHSRRIVLSNQNFSTSIDMFGGSLSAA